MAVAYDAVSESHTGTTGSVSEASFSWTHTPVGTPKGVLVFFFATGTAGPSGAASSVTYGGVTMTKYVAAGAVDNVGELGRTDAYFLGSSVPTGAQTVTVNRTNNAIVEYAVAITVTANNNTDVTGAVNQSGDQAPAEANVDDGSPGTNSVRFAGAYYGGSNLPVAGAHSTALIGIDFGLFTCAVVRETTAGQGSRPVGFADASDDWACVLLAVKELASSIPNKIYTYLQAINRSNTY